MYHYSPKNEFIKLAYYHHSAQFFKLFFLRSTEVGSWRGDGGTGRFSCSKAEDSLLGKQLGSVDQGTHSFEPCPLFGRDLSSHGLAYWRLGKDCDAVVSRTSRLHAKP